MSAKGREKQRSLPLSSPPGQHWRGILARLALGNQEPRIPSNSSARPCKKLPPTPLASEGGTEGVDQSIRGFSFESVKARTSASSFLICNSVENHTSPPPTSSSVAGGGGGRERWGLLKDRLNHGFIGLSDYTDSSICVIRFIRVICGSDSCLAFQETPIFPAISSTRPFKKLPPTPLASEGGTDGGINQ